MLFNSVPDLGNIPVPLLMLLVAVLASATTCRPRYSEQSRYVVCTSQRSPRSARGYFREDLLRVVSVTPFDVFAQARCAALLMREWLMAYWAMVSAEISMMPGIEIASASAASFTA